MKPIPPRPRFLPPMERPELGAADSILAIYSTGRCPFCVKKPEPCAWCVQVSVSR